jgi:CubicO group peptidase (beta-lactamase class C family)
MADAAMVESRINGIDGAACRAAGVDPAAMSSVSDFFTAMIGDALHPGAQLAVVKNDYLLAFFADGHEADGNQVDQQSLICMLSCSKLLGTLVMAHLHDSGVFAFNDKIAKHWPEFAANGKQDITIAQLMSHRAGLAASIYGDYAQWGEWDKPGGIEKLIVDMSPSWPPGTANGYHALTFGHVIECLVRRWTNKTTGEVLRDDITGPLGLEDIYLGLPREIYDTRYAKLFANAAQKASRSALVASGTRNPPDAGEHFFNSYSILKQSLPWGGGVANAADFAQLMGVYANKGSLRGRTIFTPATFDFISTPTNKPEDVDRLLMRHAHWGTGVLVDQTEGVGNTGPVFGLDASPRTVGHLGGTSAMAWADPQTRVSLVFLSTRAPAPPNYQALSNAVRAAVS